MSTRNPSARNIIRAAVILAAMGGGRRRGAWLIHYSDCKYPAGTVLPRVRDCHGREVPSTRGVIIMPAWEDPNNYRASVLAVLRAQYHAIIGALAYDSTLPGRHVYLVRGSQYAAGATAWDDVPVYDASVVARLA